MFEVIASREFELKSEMLTGAVLLEIGKPEASGAAEWCCEIRVHAPEGVINRRRFGADSVQTLAIGIRGAELELEMLRAAYAPRSHGMVAPTCGWGLRLRRRLIGRGRIPERRIGGHRANAE